MRKSVRIIALSLVLTAPLLLPAGLVHSQVGPDALENCEGFAFSTEEDFVSLGPEPADGNPLISDGDLLGPDGVVCARNADLLLSDFDVARDLGLDAADVLDVDDYLVAFSTEIDSPHGDQFTAGDLLITNGSIIANVALTHKFAVGYDVGLDAVHFVGDEESISTFLSDIQQYSREDWLQSPGVLYQVLDRNGVDIWFSTEGTWTPAGAAGFLDGDLLSAASGTIMAKNGTLLPNTVPADVRDKGVDFGLDAFASFFRSVEMGLAEGYFSTEILYNDPAGGLSFTDGDGLKVGNGIAFVNGEVVAPFEPAARELGLDALTFVERPPQCEEILEITEVGGISVDLIDSVTGYARKENGASPPAPPPAPAPHDRPFGQWVSIRGNVPVPDCLDVSQYEYRVEFKEAAGSWLPIITPGALTPMDTTDDWMAEQSPAFSFCHPFSLWASYQSDTDGWISLEDYWRAKACMAGHTLNMWNTSGKNGAFRLRLALRQVGVSGSEVTSTEVPVFLDNRVPDPVEMTLYDAAGTDPLSDQCKVTGPGDNIVVTIKGQARDNGVGAEDDGDEHFRMYELSWTGGDVHVWETVPLAATEPAGYRYYDGGRLDLDGTGTLPPTATDVPMGRLDLTTEHNAHAGTDPPPCGYTIRLRAWDRTIRGRFYHSTNVVTDLYEFGWHKDYMQSFCFEPSGSQ
jgi:hypothetical protein